MNKEITQNNISLIIFNMMTMLKRHIDSNSDRPLIDMVYANTLYEQLERLYKDPFLNHLDRIKRENNAYLLVKEDIRYISRLLSSSESMYKSKYEKYLEKYKALKLKMRDRK